MGPSYGVQRYGARYQITFQIILLKPRRKSVIWRTPAVRIPETHIKATHAHRLMVDVHTWLMTSRSYGDDRWRQGHAGPEGGEGLMTWTIHFDVGLYRYLHDEPNVWVRKKSFEIQKNVGINIWKVAVMYHLIEEALFYD